MDAPFPEQRTARCMFEFTKPDEANSITATSEHSVVNHRSTGRAVKHIDAVLPRIALVMPFYTRSTVNRYDIIRTISLSSSPWI